MLDKIFSYKFALLLLDFLKVLVWPGIVFLFTMLFRKNIAKLIDEILELKILGNEAKRAKEQLPQDKPPITDIDILSKYESLAETYKKTVDSLSESKDNLKNELTNKEIELDFERTYNIIFGSQLFLLDSLSFNNNMNYDVIDNYYKTIQKNNPALSTWNTNQYLSFLFSSGLIEWNNKGAISIQITVKGNAFMYYIKSLRGYNLNKGL